MEDKTHVTFSASNYAAEASVISKLMQCDPTSILVVGQPKPNVPTMLSRANMWILNSPLPRTAHVEEHLEALLPLLETRAEAIEELVKVHQADIGINCSIYYRDFTPGIHLSQSLLKRIAALGLYLDLDLYFLGDAKKHA